MLQARLGRSSYQQASRCCWMRYRMSCALSSRVGAVASMQCEGLGNAHCIDRTVFMGYASCCGSGLFKNVVCEASVKLQGFIATSVKCMHACNTLQCMPKGALFAALLLQGVVQQRSL